MGYSFDGANKIITLTVGTTGVDVKDIYSRWKDWCVTSDGSKYLQTFLVVGGEPIDAAAGTYVATYVFLTNGWLIRPQEADHKLKVYNGILLTDTGDDPFLQTLGSYNVLVQYSQPVQAQSVVIETGTSGLTTEESDTLLAITPTLSAEISTLSDSVSATTVAQTSELLSFMKGKKYLSKEGSVWYLVVRNIGDTADIMKKALKDKDGSNITDIAAGVIAQELETSV